jgi:hypothetical protein
MLKEKDYMCKKIVRKNLAKKRLWTFEWPKMSHIFISPNHYHFLADFNFFVFKMYIKKLFTKTILYMNFIVH